MMSMPPYLGIVHISERQELCYVRCIILWEIICMRSKSQDQRNRGEIKYKVISYDREIYVIPFTSSIRVRDYAWNNRVIELQSGANAHKCIVRKNHKTPANKNAGNNYRRVMRTNSSSRKRWRSSQKETERQQICSRRWHVPIYPSAPKFENRFISDGHSSLRRHAHSRNIASHMPCSVRSIPLKLW